MTGAMAQGLVLDPLLPWPLIWALAAGAALATGLAFWRRLGGAWLRLGAALLLLAGIAQPALQTEERSPENDIVLLIRDESASQKIGDRPAQSARAVRQIEAEVAALPDTELRSITVGDGQDNAGTLVMTALARALAETPRDRIAGAILVSDGQLHDLDIPVEMPAPLNLLLSGHAGDWDRRLKVQTAPAFGIIGEELTLILRVEESGQVPAAEAGKPVAISVSVDGAAPELFTVPVGQDLGLPLTLGHGGQNVVQLELAPAEGEVTDRNNTAVVQINGIRDRLRVLLVSGEPYAGERTWRNLLKSDSAVDLVHFTILRPPDKQDGVSVSELSLIAFPTRELFVEKIQEFDLIIFDRYRLRGILPSAYLDNIRDYVLGGGAVLVSAGAEFASAESLYFSGLGDILPARPTARVIEQGYLPRVSELGARHPVTEALEAAAPGEAIASAQDDTPGAGPDAAPPWGRWLRIVELTQSAGDVVMEGPDSLPLLVLDRVGEGRVALLASDHAWLWGRGFEGGGPQLELLRRLAHWMMKEPDLEEEALTATAEGQTMTITRRSLDEGVRELTVTAPDGSETVLQLKGESPGRYVATYEAPGTGLYRLSDGELERVVALGPTTPREFEEAIASAAPLAPIQKPTQGGALRIEDGSFDLRQVRAGRPAAGRGWIGITPRGAYRTLDIRIGPLLPAWVFLLLSLGLIVAAWTKEGRR